jgi:hypothetical protein
MGGGWQAVGPCHKQRYLRYDPASTTSGGDAAAGGEAGSSSSSGNATGAAAGALLAQIRDELFTSAAFARLLNKVRGEWGAVWCCWRCCWWPCLEHLCHACTGIGIQQLYARIRSVLTAPAPPLRPGLARTPPLRPLQLTTIGLLGQQAEVRRFRPGLDYTVAHYGVLTKDPQLDAVLCFVTELAGTDDKEVWDGGEVGGFEAYLLADEDGEAAEVYKAVSGCCLDRWGRDDCQGDDPQGRGRGSGRAAERRRGPVGVPPKRGISTCAQRSGAAGQRPAVAPPSCPHFQILPLRPCIFIN